MQVNRNRFRTGPGLAFEPGLGGCRSLAVRGGSELAAGPGSEHRHRCALAVAVIQGGSDCCDDTPAGLHGLGIRGVSELGGTSPTAGLASGASASVAGKRKGTP